MRASGGFVTACIYLKLGRPGDLSFCVLQTIVSEWAGPARRLRRPTAVCSMTTRSKSVISILVAVPLLSAALWLASGREVFTKSGRALEVHVADDLFGGTNTETRFEPGPVLGYYIGLDLVGAATGLAAVAAIVWWRLAIRRRRRLPSGGQQDA